MKAVKIIGITVASVLALIILLAVSYVIYVYAEYDRIEDKLAITPDQNSELIADRSQTFSMMTYNIGFGAYDDQFSFFMDSGEDAVTGEKQSGKYGKAVSKDNVLKNVNGAIDTIADNIVDFVLLQEVDTEATRSYKVNEYDMVRTSESLKGYSHNFAQNFHSAYLMYPLFNHHGKNDSGIATISKYNVKENIRRSYPLDTGFAKFFDLDRCFMISRVPLNDGKELTIINSHMSAYDEGGKIRELQLAMLNQVMSEEYNKGNYVVVGGDFNHDLIEGGSQFPTGQKYPAWVNKLSNSDLSPNFRIVADASAGTCRAAEIPYEKGYNFEVVVDGFIVSDNIDVVSIKNIGEHAYKYSDHNPAVMQFKLK